MCVYRLNVVGKDGRHLILGTADTASQALSHIREAFGDFRRAWVTNEHDEDESLADLLRLAEGEQRNAGGMQDPPS